MAVRDAQNRALRVVGSQTDVTDRKRAEQRLQHDALHDALTGLPNRVLFLDRLDQAIRRAKRANPAAAAAVLFLDLDRFKLVNDSLGHQVGDRLLVAVARRLESAVRPPDTVARLGGDEFTVLLDGVANVHEASLIAERVHHTLRTPFEIDDRELFIDASIGIALADSDAAPDTVLRDADVAMYRAKAEGKGRSAVFDGRMNEQVTRRLDMETDLRRAIEEQALEVVYQPIVQAATGRIAGFEALCRWPDSGGGFVEPSEFVPIAEETGLIVPLGRWVLRAACEQLAAWRALPQGAGLVASVNVSHRQLADPEFGLILAGVARGDRPRPGGAAAGGQGERAQPRARLGAARARARARGARRALAHRRLRDRRVLAPAPARLPRRRGEDPPRAGDRHGRRAGRVRDREGARRARAQPRPRGDRRGRRDGTPSSIT